MNDWNRIRAHYARITPLILAERKNEWAVDAYDWDEGKGMIHLTPIESWLWADIRNANAVFYPQYPVGRFFVDFANPKAKVAIECDGAAYHLDKAKDEARDELLGRMGWVVYRAPGWLCRTEFNPETGEPGKAAQFVNRIVHHHGLARDCGPVLDGEDDWEPISVSIDRYCSEVNRYFGRHVL